MRPPPQQLRSLPFRTAAGRVRAWPRCLAVQPVARGGAHGRVPRRCAQGGRQPEHAEARRPLGVHQEELCKPRRCSDAPSCDAPGCDAPAARWLMRSRRWVAQASANRKFMAINIADIVDELITEKLALRLSATLMSGVVRVYAMKENQLEKKALEASNEMRKKMINAGANVTLPKDRQTAAHDKITMSDDAGDTLMLLTSQPDDLEDLANLDMGEWTVTNDPAARVSVSDVQKSAVTLPDRDDGMLGDGDFEIGFGDEFGLMDNNDADGFDDMQESGGFQLDDLETQQQLDEPDAGMIEFTMCAPSAAPPSSASAVP